MPDVSAIPASPDAPPPHVYSPGEHVLLTAEIVDTHDRSHHVVRIGDHTVLVSALDLTAAEIQPHIVEIPIQTDTLTQAPPAAAPEEPAPTPIDPGPPAPLAEEPAPAAAPVNTEQA